MSGYFSQLIHQSGVRIGAGTPAFLTAPSAAMPAYDIAVEESSLIAPKPSTSLSSVAPDVPLQSMPRAAEERSQFEALVQARSQVEPEIGVARAADVSGAAQSENVNSAAAGSETSRAADATICEVMDWIARPAESDMPQDRKAPPIEIGSVATPTAREPGDDRGLPLSEQQPPSTLSFYQTVERAGSQPAPTANSAEAPWSVHIGAIHLEIEAPRPAPNPRPPAPQPVTAARSAPRGSRLRRYYL